VVWSDAHDLADGDTFVLKGKSMGVDKADSILGCGFGVVGGRLGDVEASARNEVAETSFQVIEECLGNVNPVWSVGGHTDECAGKCFVVLVDGAVVELAGGWVSVDHSAVG